MNKFNSGKWQMIVGLVTTHVAALLVGFSLHGFIPLEYCHPKVHERENRMVGEVEALCKEFDKLVADLHASRVESFNSGYIRGWNDHDAQTDCH